jgi:hypothetical protein
VFEPVQVPLTAQSLFDLVRKFHIERAGGQSGGFQIVQAGAQQGALDDVLGEAVVLLPVSDQDHSAEMRAGGMTRQVEAIRITTNGSRILVNRRLPVKLIHGLDCTKAIPTSVPVAPQHTPVSSLRVYEPTMATNPLSTLHQRFACARLSRPCLPGSSSRRFRNAHHHGS